MTAPVPSTGSVLNIHQRYQPREHFKAFHARDKRFAVLVCHRRAGKTEAAIHDMVDKAMRIRWKGLPGKHNRDNAPPRYMYIAPEKTQAKDTVWERLKGAVRHIAHECVIRDS